uniref:Uncharacterized protein n=1 Tax=Rhizophagus irregularis (strain DAOM 181602 / DAOM 197198 / MUCL 43194) TaxID=747089 RepID=U9U4E4_RHIID
MIPSLIDEQNIVHISHTFRTFELHKPSLHKVIYQNISRYISEIIDVFTFSESNFK